MTTLDERPADTLAPEERADLAKLEAVIGDGLRVFERTGAALAEIRDRRLYRADFETFDAYLEARWGFTRQRASQLITGAQVAHTLASTIGLQPETEREARDLKPAAKVVQELEPEQQQIVARFIQATTGTERPSTSQIKAVAEVVQAIDQHGTVEHPDTGEQVPFTDLPEPARMAVIRENVSNSTYERVQRQKDHIEESRMQANSSGRGGWTDWCMTYAAQHLTADQELVIRVFRDEAGNPQAQALVRNAASGNTLVFGDRAPYLKKAVLNLVEEVKA